jgi:hypothetical protein
LDNVGSCGRCKRPLIEIDHYGERLIGCVEHPALTGVLATALRRFPLEAFKLIAPFRSRSATEPINPEWRRPTPRVSLRADAA